MMRAAITMCFVSPFFGNEAMKRIFTLVVLATLASCHNNTPPPISESRLSAGSADTIAQADSTLAEVLLPPRGIYTAPFPDSITIGHYFYFMDSLVLHYDSLLPYTLTEHIIVHANPWIIDSLAATDYYYKMEKGIFVYDQKSLVILEKGDSLLIPDSLYAMKLQQHLDSVIIDVNVPEFTLRILIGKTTIYSFPVRVGQYRTKFLQLAGREFSLQTDLGSGTIVRIARDPYYINPVNGHRYFSTLRDDGRRTNMPQIPWLETELNGIRNGDMIHPTTNPKTLGKAWSNGCIGTKEGDAWRIYYHAPLGTRVRVRYDLKVVQPNGDTLFLPDIYEKNVTKKPLHDSLIELKSKHQKHEQS